MKAGKRQLAAIMFSDIVGYTGIMGEDETLALELVRKNREMQQPLVEKHNGAWLKELGDGVMTMFPSALDAVNCALEIQAASQVGFGANLRIGIHLGDITLENNDVYGEGVNIASRLESIAAPGSIYVSEAVYHALSGRADIHLRYIGKRVLKNVKEPVRTYMLKADGPGKSLKNYRRKYKYLVSSILILVVVFAVLRFRPGILNGHKGIPSLMVLPVTAVDDDTTDLYLVEGLTEELIRSLGKIGSITVINPHTAMRYLGSLNPVVDAGSDLPEVNYFLNGTFDKNGLSITINMELLDQRQVLVWSNSYTEDLARTPELIGRITTNVSSAIKVELSGNERQRIAEISDVDPEIYELLLKGWSHLNNFTPEDFRLALVYLQEVVDKNPANARAWAGLAEAYVYMGHSPDPPPNAWKMAKSGSVRAIQLDSTLAEAWATLAHTKYYFEWDYEGAEICFRRANLLNPSLAPNHYHYAWFLALFDRLDEAIIEHKLAQQLDPFAAVHTAWLAWLLEKDGQVEEAFAEARRSLEVEKDFPLGYYMLGHLHQQVESYDSAIFYFRKAAKLNPSFRYFGLMEGLLVSGEFEEGMAIIRELESIPLNSFGALMLAMAYASIDSVDKFFEYISYNPKHAWANGVRILVENPLVQNDPRFRDLMVEMNLPVSAVQHETAARQE